MNRTRVTVACALALALVGSLAATAAPVPVHLMPKPQLFFPTKLGAKHVSIWEQKELVEVVSKVTPVEGGFEVVMETVSEAGTRQHSETVVVTTRGLVRTHSYGRKHENPCVLLKLPHDENNTWKSDWGEQQRTLRTADWEEVEVPAGKMRALRVEHDESGEGKYESSMWYAPEIGCVNWYCTRCKVGRPLKAFTPGK
jgi:hypothetical protein